MWRWNYKDCFFQSNLNSCHITCEADVPDSVSLHVIIPTNRQFSHIMSELASVCRAHSEILEPRHHVTHHIISTGPLVYAKAPRLHANKLKAAKQEFLLIFSLGIFQTVHLVTKKNNDWRPCWDYRALNQIAFPHRYLNPHIQDFSLQLNGKRPLFKLNLLWVHHQIPMTPEDIVKTALLTPIVLFRYLGCPLVFHAQFGYSNVSSTKYSVG